MILVKKNCEIIHAAFNTHKKTHVQREGKLTGHIHKKPEFREFSTPAIGLFL